MASFIGLATLERSVWLCPAPQVPHEMVAQFRDAYVEAEIHAPTLEDLGSQLEDSGATLHTYLDQLLQGLQKEAKEKFKGWVACPSADNTDLACKKVISGLPETYPEEPHLTTRNLFCLKTKQNRPLAMGLSTHATRRKSVSGDGQVAGLHMLGAQAMKPACWAPVQSLSPGCVTSGRSHGSLCLGSLSCRTDIINMARPGEGCWNTPWAGRAPDQP